MKKERNKTLDYIRSINMWYIILVIHFLFWLGFSYKMEYSTICLVEMFTVFFLTGTSLKYEKEIPYGKYLLKKMKRVYLPYFVFSIVSVAVVYIINKLGLINSENSITSLKVLEGIFNPLSQNFNRYHFSVIFYQIWFIPVYIMLTIYMPILLKCIKKNSLLTFFVAILIYQILKNVSITVINENYNFIYPIIYNFKVSLFFVPFIIMGYKYEWFLKNKLKTFMLLIISAILFLLLYLNGEHNMQKLKFEFAKEYFLLGTTFTLLLLLVYQYISRVIEKIPVVSKYLIYFSKISFHAYLYHSIAYVISLILFLDVLNINNIILKYILLVISVFTLTNILSQIFFKVENILIGAQEKIYSKLHFKINNKK